MTLTEREIAARLFAVMTGKPAPSVLRWNLDAMLNNGSQPMYERDDKRRVVKLHLHQGQLTAWESGKRIIAILAGTQGGKTSFEPWWLAREILRLGGGDYIAVTVSYDLFKLKMLPAMREVFEHTLKIGRWWSGDKVLEIADPDGVFWANRADDRMYGRVILRSAASEGGLESASAKAAILDEAGQDGFSLQAWEAVLRRLALSRGRVLIGTTPYNEGWLKTQLYDRWAKGERETIDVIQFASTLNPAFSTEEFEERRRTMPEYRFKMMYRGEFDRPPGVIYGDFINALKEDGGHKYQRFAIPTEFPRYVAIDPGIVNPAKIWAAHDVNENAFYIYRAEKGGARLTSKEHAKADVQKARELGERVIKWAIGAKSEKYWREDYSNAGAKGVSEPDTQDVLEGIDRVTQLLKEHRLFIAADLVDLLDEISHYSREVDDMGNVLDKIKDKETYHLLDALRYLAVCVVKPKKKFTLDVGVSRYA